MKRDEVADHLAGLSLFDACSKRDLRHLARATHQHQIDVGQHVFEQGQPANAAYLVVAGHVEVKRDGRLVAEIGPGQVVGELGLLLQRKRSATVTATTPVEVLALSQIALREAIDEVPGLAWRMLQAVAERLSGDTTVTS